MIAAPEGIKKMQTEFPQVNIVTAAIDNNLNDKKFICPGLGDFGDRFNGTI
jgi:uracil phosphoribosyltransferase